MNMFWPEMLNGPSNPRRRAAYLVLGAIVVVLAAWSIASDAGAPIALMAMLYGFVACAFMRTEQPTAAEPAAPPPTVAPVEVAPVEALLEAQRVASVALRHDVRGMLSPALMVSDRMLAHPDPDVRRAGEVVARTVQRVADRLAEEKIRDSAGA